MIDVAPFGGDHAARRLADAVAEPERHGEDVGAESSEVFVGQDVTGDRFEHHPVPERVAGGGNLGDP